MAQLQSFYPPWLFQQRAKSQVFILAGNRSLHSNREQLLAAPLNFKILSTSLKQLLQPVSYFVSDRAGDEPFHLQFT